MLNLETWLKRRPRPAHLRFRTASGETRDMDLGAVRSWARVADTVITLDAVSLEALAPDKSLIRATRLDDVEDADDDLDDVESLDARASTPPSRGARASVSLGADPETERFRIFTEAIAQAYSHATGTAFDKMAEVCAMVTSRVEVQERTLASVQDALAEANEEIMALQAELVQARATPASDGSIESLVSNFAQGAAFGGLGGAEPPTAPNGAHQPNGRHPS